MEAARIALRHHVGAGDRLCCFGPTGDAERPCYLVDEPRELRGHYVHAAHRALDALNAGTGRLTYQQMDAIGIALGHAGRHPPGGQPGPYPFGEAGGILDVWMQDYDRRLTS